VCTRKYVKMSQQLKLSNFLKRKGDNVTGANKQSKSSTINNVEIADFSPASKVVRVKPKSGRCSRKEISKDSFKIYGFLISHLGTPHKD